MKNGKTLVELAQELERQSQAKQDFVTSTDTMEVTPKGELILAAPNSEADSFSFSLTDNAHSQISQRLNIPLKYYRRMRVDAPELLATNVNTWFQQQPERRMIRTLDHQARAFLSDRYRRLDNYQLADVVLNTLSDLGEGIKIISCELTDKRMYIKAINQRLELEVNKGDTVQAAVDQAKFTLIVQQLKDSTQKPIEGNPVKTVEVLANDFHYSESETNGILNHLIHGGDLSAYGLCNAITRTSQDLDDYDRATDLERDGSRILSLAKSSWQKLANPN